MRFKQRRLETLGSVFAERIVLATTVIDARKSQGFAGAQRVVLTGKGKELNDQIRGLVGEMVVTEQELLQARQERTKNAAGLTELIIISGVYLQ